MVSLPYPPLSKGVTPFFTVSFPVHPSPQARNNFRTNHLHRSCAAVRIVVEKVYGEHENGSPGKLLIVADNSYRDSGTILCGDRRFQKAIIAWYGKSRRLTKRQLNSIRIEDMELTRKEIAMVDMTVSWVVGLSLGPGIWARAKVYVY
jgi:hypothetical protein